LHMKGRYLSSDLSAPDMKESYFVSVHLSCSHIHLLIFTRKSHSKAKRKKSSTLLILKTYSFNLTDIGGPGMKSVRCLVFFLQFTLNI
jgi:hypothetical protein